MTVKKTKAKVVRKDKEVKKVTILLKMDSNRLNDMVTVDQFLGLQEGDTRNIIEVISLFVWDAGRGRYFSAEKGRKIIGKMKMSEMKELSKSFFKEAQDEAVPPAKGSDS